MVVHDNGFHGLSLPGDVARKLFIVGMYLSESEIATGFRSASIINGAHVAAVQFATRPVAASSHSISPESRNTDECHNAEQKRRESVKTD
ncbi:hypothetical protein [Aureimonas sp. N4]|uniref:hypothetical protein n=1 Tax=Aureimonas sp. N4 TaxID=1638165 RepID=UPI0012E3306C|nr:hypothetical protein [Aureimonas sp. N4]